MFAEAVRLEQPHSKQIIHCFEQIIYCLHQSQSGDIYRSTSYVYCSCEDDSSMCNSVKQDEHNNSNNSDFCWDCVRSMFYTMICCISFELSCYYSLATLAGGFHWRDTRSAAPAAASRLLSYCQNPGAPPPSRLAGALTHAVSGDRDPQW